MDDTKTIINLLQLILAGDALILSKLIDMEERKRGVHRIGGDFSGDAIRSIVQNRQKILLAVDAASL